MSREGEKMFVGRSSELNHLEILYRERNVSTMLVYGEYAIGVTALLQQFMKKKKAAYFSVRNALPTVNLAAFCLELKEQGILDEKADYLDWRHVLNDLMVKATQQKVLLLIDDVQYLQSAVPSFFSILKELLQIYEGQIRLTLVFGAGCLSVEKIMLRDKKHPFYGCFAKVLHLKALDYFEAQEFMEGLHPEDKVCLYGVTGGIPQYLSHIDRSVSLKENVCRLFFEPEAILYKEPLSILRQELREPSTYHSILCSVACGARRLYEIAAAVDLECNKVSKYVGVLVDMKLLNRIKPVGEKDTKRSFYVLDNSMFDFWYRFVFPYFSSIVAERGTQLFRNKVIPQIEDFLSWVFREICRQYCLRLRDSRDFSFDFREIGYWWNSGGAADRAVMIDLLAINMQQACFIDCYWSNKKIGSDKLLILQDKSKFTNFKKKQYLLFSKSGFTDECLAASAQDNAIRLISLNYIK